MPAHFLLFFLRLGAPNYELIIMKNLPRGVTSPLLRVEKSQVIVKCRILLLWQLWLIDCIPAAILYLLLADRFESVAEESYCLLLELPFSRVADSAVSHLAVLVDELVRVGRCHYPELWLHIWLRFTTIILILVNYLSNTFLLLEFHSDRVHILVFSRDFAKKLALSDQI